MVNLLSRFNQMRLLFNNTKNPFSLMMYYMGLKKEVICYLKYNGGSFKLSIDEKELLGRNLVYFDDLIKSNHYEKIGPYINFLNSLNEDVLDVDGVKFYNNEYKSILWEYFMDNPFIDDDFDNRVVIDVGANIGDTALFNAKNGATVYAFEPIFDTYDIALKNIELNPDLAEKIHCFNYAIDGEDGLIEIYYEDDEHSASASSFSKNGSKITVQALSIESILKKFNIKPDILKIDCEGAEYSILEKSDLSMFNKILIEYHEKFVGISYEVLVNQLKKMGFEVIVKKNGMESINDFGFIIATKIK